MDSGKRIYNAIHNIMADGELQVESLSIKDAIVQCNSEDHPSRPFFKEIVYDTISFDDSLELEKDFSTEEVWDVSNE